MNRECTQDFKVPNSSHTIKKGTSIIIPLLAIHRDDKYFPNAMKYDPERFLPEIQNYNPVAYLPFGEGPRHCIGKYCLGFNIDSYYISFVKKCITCVRNIEKNP